MLTLSIFWLDKLYLHINIHNECFRNKKEKKKYYTKLVVNFPVLLKYSTEGNSQYISMVRSIGKPSENCTETLKFPTLIEGMT